MNPFDSYAKDRRVVVKMNHSLPRTRTTNMGFGLIIISYLLIVFSSPMPIEIGVVEVVMGLGLTTGTLLLGFSFVARKVKNLKSLFLCAAYFILMPLLVGFLHGNKFSDITRDVAPLMFMVTLPLLIMFLPQDKETYLRIRALLAVIFVVGLANSFQFYHGITQAFGSIKEFVAVNVGGFTDKESFADVRWSRDVIIRVFDPAVIFSAIYLLCVGFEFILAKPRQWVLALLAFGVGGFCAYEFAALGLRAFSGLTALALIVYGIHLVSLKKAPKWHLIVAGGLVLIFVSTYLTDVMSLMWMKHQAVGGNGKLAEFSGVLGAISESHYTLLFGTGWGGVFFNPILSMPTRFTHSLISFGLLKVGVVGFAVMVSFIILLFRRISLRGVWASSRRLATFLAASAVIIIGLLFEPTYKMLSFGLIVGLLLAEISLPPELDQEINIEQKPV